MDKIYQSFIVEANELLVEIEKGLLQLEGQPNNKESISSVFRSMHTLKGSAGMFGLESMTNITHELETIFESIRDGKLDLTQEILSTSFESLDHLKKILNDPEMKDKGLAKKQVTLLEKIQSLSNAVQSSVTKPEKAPNNLFYIDYSPASEDIVNGAKPLFVVEDLLNSGEGISLPYFKDLPTLNDLDVLKAYTSFEIILLTDLKEQDIVDSFIFSGLNSKVEVKELQNPDPAITDQNKELLKDLNKHGRVGYEKIKSLFMVEDAAATTENDNVTSSEKAVSSSIRVDSERIDELMNLISELVTTQAQLTTYSDSLNSPHLSAIGENVEKITRRLRDNAFRMSLIPIESLVFRFKRLIRDLAVELDKDVSFITEGTDTEIDKSIVEKLNDPLLHIIRNSLDHGIEPAEVREAAGKPSKGTVKLKAYYSGANVIIEISDDGAGIAIEKVRKKAIERGLTDAITTLTDNEVLDFIFSPGFSTAGKVTGVSGRGVGMDVVKRNISDLRGEIAIETKEGEGTKFIIQLPLTLSIMDGLLVNVGETFYIIPLQSVNKCFEVPTDHFRNSFNDWVTLENERTPYVFLRDKYNIVENDPQYSQVIKVPYKEKYVGLVVDKIMGEYQAVLKPLGEQYKKQDEFSGATILGDGTVALVMDPLRIIHKMMEHSILI